MTAFAPTESLPSGSIAPGTEFAGRYRIEGLVGEGGIGQVYRARHKFLRTTVAIKVLRPRADERLADIRRFEREAFALGKLAHDNCLAVTDFGEYQGQWFLVTEFLDGKSLGDVAHAEGRLETARALEILAQVLRALGHAHEQGIIHRDLKPDNILLVERHGSSEFAKVLDFGLAKLMGETLTEEGGGELTQTGITFGTPKYMAPEQIVGSEVGPATDLYAVSCIAYRLLAGRAPFVNDDAHDLLMAHCTKVAPMFAELGVQDVPRAVEEMIRRGLAKKPEDRFSSSREYLEAIDSCFSGPVSAEATRSVRKNNRGDHSALDRQPEVSERPATLEMPDPPAKARPPWLLPATVFTALCVVATIIAAFSSAPSEANPGTSAAPALQMGTDDATASSLAGIPNVDYVFDEPGLEDIRGLIANGRTETAIKRLRPHVKSGTFGGRAAFLLGTLYFRKMYWSDGFDAYATAIKRDPSYRAHPLVLANSVAGLGSRSKPWLAERFIRKHFDKAVLPYLDGAAEGAKHEHHRKRAAKLARKLRAR